LCEQGKESALGLLELWAPDARNKSYFMRTNSLDALVAAAAGDDCDAWLRAAAANVLHRLADYPPNTAHTIQTVQEAQSLVSTLRGWERPTVTDLMTAGSTDSHSAESASLGFLLRALLVSLYNMRADHVTDRQLQLAADEMAAGGAPKRLVAHAVRDTAFPLLPRDTPLEHATGGLDDGSGAEYPPAVERLDVDDLVFRAADTTPSAGEEVEPAEPLPTSALEELQRLGLAPEQGAGGGMQRGALRRRWAPRRTWCWVAGHTLGLGACWVPTSSWTVCSEKLRCCVKVL